MRIDLNKTTFRRVAWVTLFTFAIFFTNTTFCQNVLAISQEPPFDLPKTSEVNKLKSAVLFTNKGQILLELYPEDAPWHVANFKYLADKGFYRNIKFHLFSPGYFIQGGAPIVGNAASGPGWDLPAEFNAHKNIAGALVMSRVYDDNNPSRNSHGSQFILLLDDVRKMDGRYTVFGQVVKGMDVVQKLEKDDEILDLKVFVRNK